MEGPGSAVVTVLVALGVAIVVFLVLRVLALWYWRVNEIVEKLDRMVRFASGIVDRLDKLIIVSGGRPDDWPSQDEPVNSPPASDSYVGSLTPPEATLISRSDTKNEAEYLAWSSKKIKTLHDLALFRMAHKPKE